MCLVLAIFVLSLSLGQVRSEVHEPTPALMSLPGMELLLNTERELLLNLENYANAMQAKIDVIRRAIAEMRTENLKSIEDAETYLSNPLNSFALIRRMHTDWIHWEFYMKSPVGEYEIYTNQELRINLPKSEDMDKATAAMNRLQITYNLEPIEMAAGVLNGKQYNTSLSSRDCFEIGQRLLSQGDIFYSSNWLYAALMRYQENEVETILGFDLLQIYDLYMETFLKQYRYNKALEVANIALEYSPNDTKFLNAKSLIEYDMITSEETPIEFEEYVSELYKLYYRCCRGEFDNRLTRLHCRYNTTTHPFLKLAPFKMEELLMDPYIVLFYDVISDAEIAFIKSITHPNLEPSLVYDEDNGGSIPDKGRTNHESSLWDNENNITIRIVQRITDMSGFDLKGSKNINAMHYVLAAHYEPHFDFFNATNEDNEMVRGVGDRIATVIFYLSDVDQGGSTVFPDLKIAVHPRKGSALMWYNLHNSGNVDDRTYHASCPVIVGSKWIGTQWIHERAQTFRRPCFV